MTNGRRGFATPEPPAAATTDRKKELRRAAKARRAEAYRTLGEAAGSLLRDHFAAEVTLAGDAVVAGYAPIDDEMDAMALLSMLSERGHACALPVVAGRDRPLVFRRWTPGMALQVAEFGVAVPPPSAPELRPTAVLVPMLAFDARGHRVGYGAGFYDRTLAALRRDGAVTAIGIAYADQQVDAVPADDHDAPLDLIVTERSVIRPRG